MSSLQNRQRLSGRSTWYEKNWQSRFSWHFAWQASADNTPSAMLYAKALAYIYDDVQMPPPTRDDCREAINILTDVLGRARRVLGPSHPITTRAEDWLQTTRLVVRGLEFRWLVQESM